MRRWAVGLMGMAALLGSLLFAPAFGAPTSQPLGLRAAEDAQSPIQDVQFFWNGFQYCWFDFGWRGPGWYVCDYGPWVTGRWWGGASGFRGWSVARGRRFRPEFRRQFAGRPGITGPSRPGRPGSNVAGPSRPNRPGSNVAGPSRPNRPGSNVAGPSRPNRPGSNVAGPSRPSRPGSNVAGSRPGGPGAAATGTVGRGPGGGGPGGRGGPRGGGGGGNRRPQ
jgi:hypothetical protein